ncbi:MAG: hypothetical protein HY674_02365 [Chloroflexi bacterium]|nr:hypothetical protein [Chloroflexota bacterium]
MKSIVKPVVCKTIFQVRYKPGLRFYDIFRAAAQKLAGYPHWTTDSLSVTLRDFDNVCSINIQHNLFTFQQDSRNPENEVAKVNAALEVLPPSLEISSFKRLGYRRQYLIAVDMAFDSLVSVLKIKLLSQDDRLLSFLPPRLEDLLYRVDCADGLHRFHLHVGPMQKHEVPRYVAFDAENHLAPEDRDDKYRLTLAGYPETSVLVDIDVYRIADEIPLNEAAEFVVAARDKADNLSSRLTEYLFADKVKV